MPFKDGGARNDVLDAEGAGFKEVRGSTAACGIVNCEATCLDSCQHS